MKWLGRWLFKTIKASQEDEKEYGTAIAVGSSTKIRGRGSEPDSDEGLNITVRQAIGGRIVTFRHYDHKHDRNSYKNYVIPDDMDFERELGKMITLESMRG